MSDTPVRPVRRYRPHRGGLADALAESLTFADRADLQKQLRARGEIDDDDPLRSKEYGGDEERTGWRDVHIVLSARGFVVGFCEERL